MRRTPLPTIYETAHLRMEMDGRAAVIINPDIAGRGPRPNTPLAFHRGYGPAYRGGVPAHRAPERVGGIPGLLNQIQQGLRQLNFGG
ncbi:uncharacterized protein LOC119165865 isoform X2 [Rhipicephalus microplus]